MSNITDAQTLATYNANASAGAPASVLAASGEAITETVVSATPFQISTARAATLYINITTAASMTLSMGPEAAGTSIALNASESDALGLCTVDVPAGWYVKFTGTVADAVFTAVLK